MPLLHTPSGLEEAGESGLRAGRKGRERENVFSPMATPPV
jgi:hypothetical protein